MTVRARVAIVAATVIDFAAVVLTLLASLFHREPRT